MRISVVAVSILWMAGVARLRVERLLSHPAGGVGLGTGSRTVPGLKNTLGVHMPQAAAAQPPDRSGDGAVDPQGRSIVSGQSFFGIGHPDRRLSVNECSPRLKPWNLRDLGDTGSRMG